MLKRRLSPGQARGLGQLLWTSESAPVDPDDLARLGLSPSTRAEVATAIRALPDPKDMSSVGLLLQTARSASSEAHVRICWTGPQPGRHGNARGTEAALEELIQSASRDVLVVGYRVDAGAGGVLASLERKAAEGVRLRFLLDRGATTREFKAWAKKLGGATEVYVRPEDASDPMAALHAKCVIVDGQRGLFGSANLTFHGMRGNVELGLLVDDADVIRRATELLEELRLHLSRDPP